jgi:hypothetical protein
MGVYEMFIVPGTNFITLGHFGTHTHALIRDDTPFSPDTRHDTTRHDTTRPHTSKL